ncbi:MAG: hypothetical protein GX539_05330 [Candidatus Cloacimonetes bacterium]|jgi:hypothetical protein|nr:hypothetical protein [Candidatus Cloacimonadota bacterium]
MARVAFYTLYVLGGIALLQGNSVIPLYGALLLWPLVVLHAVGGTRPSLTFFFALVIYSLIASYVIGGDGPPLLPPGAIWEVIEFGFLVLLPVGLAWWLARLERASSADDRAVDTPTGKHR